ncbi:c-Myc-binding protein-like [Rhopilema esculentum]|uniref:c-Myc-binding protein-like n=1 Tax=Rhopilema esculentum TaxID=499914 RepID=UPI0031DAF8B8
MMPATSGNTAGKPADSKREEFRKYLEKAGVLDALTRVLVALYEEPEKPNNALDFLRYHLHGGPPETADVESLKLQVSELTQKNEELTEEVTQLKQKLEQYEPKNGNEQAQES